MRNYILIAILLLSTTIKAITYPSNWGTDRIFLYDFWEQCGQPAGVNWGDLTKNIAAVNSISVVHPATGTGNNYYKVSKLFGNAKGFVGQIPAGVENLTELEAFQVNDNAGLTGVIPACFASFQKLTYLNMKNCNFTGMAAPLTMLPKNQLELQYNRIPFGDLLPMKSLARTAPGASAYSYDYLPQRAGLIVTTNTKDIANGTQLSLDIDVLLPNHGGTTFKWFLGAAQVGTGKIYTVTMSNSTAGTYKCEITTDADMQNSATCPSSSWLTARTFVYPASAITNTTEDIIVKVIPIVTPTVGTYTYTGSAQGPNTATNTGSGTSYTFSYVGTGATSYAASATVPTNAGTYTVTATVAANGNYAQASSSATAFTINKASQTITFGALPTGKTLGDADFAPGATSATSGVNAISYSTSDVAVCSILSGQIHIVGVGTCTIYADQAFSSNYNSALQVSQSITVAARPIDLLSGTKTQADFTATTADVTISGASSVLTINNIAGTTVNSLTTATGAQVNVNQPLTVATNVTVATGTKIDLTNTLTVNGDLDLKADLTSSFSVNLGSSSISLPNGIVRYLKTIDDTKWYFISFPCNIDIASIKESNGTSLGTLNTNWFIKYYNGQRRANEGSDGSNWISITPADLATAPNLLANKGYIIGLATNTGTSKEIAFPLDNAILSGEDAKTSIPVSVNTATYGTATISNYGWNLVGQPYISKFDVKGAAVPYIYFVKTGGVGYDYYLPPTDPSRIENPFSAYFVQSTGNTSIGFDTALRQSVRSSVATNVSDNVQLNFSSASGTDRTNIIMDNTMSSAYVLGQDLEKWFGSPVSVYTELGGINYALNSLPLASVYNLPVGYYTQLAGNATISVNASLAPDLSQLLLTDNGTSPATITDLLTSDYSFSASAGSDNTRFVLTAHRIPTANVIEKEVNTPTFVINNSKLIINNLGGKASVRVFDAIGRTITNKAVNNSLLEITLPVVGMYSVQIEAGGKYWTRKIVNK